MEPYKQGKLDGLCGVYSLVNAEKIINDSNQQESEEIFRKIISYLDTTKNLSRIITDGLNINVIGEVLKNIEELKIDREMPFRGEPKTELNFFWKKMQSFLDTPSRVIFLGIGGKHDHWSVVQSITDKRINFFDSDGLMFFNRINCTTQEPYGDRIHQILPTHTYFMSRCPWSC
ncbi:hypothetical protein [Desulfobacter sp.]|uniref:hypothetical protein n=1 Tax=Desulfobacter sp. TaxID=2294 RepID=UPI003D0B3BDE